MIPRTELIEVMARAIPLCQKNGYADYKDVATACPDALLAALPEYRKIDLYSDAQNWHELLAMKQEDGK